MSSSNERFRRRRSNIESSSYAQGIRKFLKRNLMTSDDNAMRSIVDFRIEVTILEFVRRLRVYNFN